MLSSGSKKIARQTQTKLIMTHLAEFTGGDLAREDIKFDAAAIVTCRTMLHAPSLLLRNDGEGNVSREATRPQHGEHGGLKSAAANPPQGSLELQGRRRRCLVPSKPAKLLRYRQTAAAALLSALVAAALPRGVTAFSLSPLRFLHQHSLTQSSLTRLRGGASVLGRRSVMMNVGAKDFDGVQVTSNFDAGLGSNPIFTSLASILSHLSIPLASISAFSAYVLVPTPLPAIPCGIS